MMVARPPDATFPNDGQLDRAFADVYAHLRGEEALTRADVAEMIADAVADAVAALDTGGSTLVDRGDPSDYDWEYGVGDLPADNAWHDLDLSSIIPANATHVLLRVIATHYEDATRSIMFRENGNANEVNVARVRMLGYENHVFGDAIVAVDGSGVIEYKLTDEVDFLDIVVRGWWTE
jgi:hypothetical protein